MPACLLPYRYLLLPSRLDLRANAQHITCMLKWSDAAAWLYMDQTEYGEGAGGDSLRYLDLEVVLNAQQQSLRYLDLEVVLNAQQQDGTAPKGV